MGDRLIFIDASAIVAILNCEPGYEALIWRIEKDKKKRYVSPLVRFEAVAALARSRSGSLRPTSKQLRQAEEIINDFCDRVEAQDISITPQIGQLAMQVACRYGKFVGHAADLNFGNCFTYACASAKNVGIIYKGGMIFPRKI